METKRSYSDGSKTWYDDYFLPTFEKKYYTEIGGALRAIKFKKMAIQWDSDVTQIIFIDVAGLGLFRATPQNGVFDNGGGYMTLRSGKKFTESFKKYEMHTARIYESVDDFKNGKISYPYRRMHVRDIYNNFLNIKPSEVEYTNRLYYVGYRWNGCKAVAERFKLPSTFSYDKDGLHFDYEEFWQVNNGLYSSKYDCENDNDVIVYDFDDDTDDMNCGETINILGKEYLVKKNIETIKQCAKVLEGLLV